MCSRTWYDKAAINTIPDKMRCIQRGRFHNLCASEDVRLGCTIAVESYGKRCVGAQIAVGPDVADRSLPTRSTTSCDTQHACICMRAWMYEYLRETDFGKAVGVASHRLCCGLIVDKQNSDASIGHRLLPDLLTRGDTRKHLRSTAVMFEQKFDLAILALRQNLVHRGWRASIVNSDALLPQRVLVDRNDFLIAVCLKIELLS